MRNAGLEEAQAGIEIAGRTGLILGWVIKILHAAWHGQNFKKFLN